MHLYVNLDECPCDNKNGTCIRRGDCKACFENHKNHASKPLTWCRRPENQQKLVKMIKEYEIKTKLKGEKGEMPL